MITGNVSRLSQKSAELPAAVTLSPKPAEQLHGKAKITDATVDFTIRIPAEITDPRPLLIVPGYLGVKGGYENYAEAVAQNGKTSIIYDPPRDRSFKSAYHIDYIRNPEDLPCKAAYGVLRAVRSEFGNDINLEKIDGEGHSLGGRILARVALHRPDLFNATLFSAAAGLEDHSTRDFLARGFKFGKNELLPNLGVLAQTTDPVVALKVGRYIFRNPLRTLAEGIAVSNCDMRHLLPKLRQFGIFTAIRNFASDELIPNSACLEEYGGIIDICEFNSDVTLGHLALQVAPDASADHAVDIFSRLGTHTVRSTAA